MFKKNRLGGACLLMTHEICMHRWCQKEASHPVLIFLFSGSVVLEPICCRTRANRLINESNTTGGLKSFSHGIRIFKSSNLFWDISAALSLCWYWQCFFLSWDPAFVKLDLRELWLLHDVGSFSMRRRIRSNKAILCTRCAWTLTLV